MSAFTTYQDYMDTIYDLISDDETNQRLATKAQIDSWANQILAEMSEHAEFLDDVDTASLITGSVSVSKPATVPVYGVRRVEIDNEAIKPITTKRLYQGSRTWQQDTGEPRFYYLDSVNGYDADTYVFRLYPKSNGSYSLRVIYSVAPDALSNASMSDQPMLPVWAAPGLVWGVLALFYEHSGRTYSQGTSAFYRRLYTDTLDRLRGRSFTRMRCDKVYGSGRGYHPSEDWQDLFPTDGITV